MFSRNTYTNIAVAIVLMTICTGASAAKTVYKWVDEDGLVHFGDAPPEQAKIAETQVLKIPKTPPSVAPAQPAPEPPAEPADTDEIQSAQPQVEVPPLFEKTDIEHLSIADLNLRCDEAREKMIAPLRENAIAECKQDKREDPAFCERFNADFGDGGRTVSGSIRPRLFDDLPECVEAQQELNRRGR